MTNPLERAVNGSDLRDLLRKEITFKEFAYSSSLSGVVCTRTALIRILWLSDSYDIQRVLGGEFARREVVCDAIRSLFDVEIPLKV